MKKDIANIGCNSFVISAIIEVALTLSIIRKIDIANIIYNTVALIDYNNIIMSVIIGVAL